MKVIMMDNICMYCLAMKRGRVRWGVCVGKIGMVGMGAWEPGFVGGLVGGRGSYVIEWGKIYDFEVD